MNFGLESSFLGHMQTAILIWCAWPARALPLFPIVTNLLRQEVSPCWTDLPLRLVGRSGKPLNALHWPTTKAPSTGIFKALFGQSMPFVDHFLFGDVR